MKRHLLLLFALLLVARARAEDISVTDGDAETYIQARNLSEPGAVSRVHAFFAGIKRLNLCSNLVLATSFSSTYGGPSSDAVGGGTTSYSFVGNNFRLVGSPTITSNGMVLTGATNQLADVVNPLGTPLTSYTVLVVAEVYGPTNSTNYSLLFGNYNYGTTEGVALWSHGNPVLGASRHSFSHTYSTDATTLSGGTGQGWSTGRGTTTGPQVLVAAYSSTNAFILPGWEYVFATTGTFASVANSISTWRAGVDQQWGKPVTGTINAVAVWNRNLTPGEAYAVRRLLGKTICSGFLPRVGILWEGEGQTAGASSETPFQRLLWTNTVWRPLVSSRNIAKTGATLSSIVTDVSTQAAPVRIEFDVHERQYYSLFAGHTDIAAGTDAYTTFGTLKTAWTLARSNGFKVIAWTLLPVKQIATNTTYAANRRTLNELIRANAAYWDVLIEPDTLPLLQDYSVGTYYNPDGNSLTTTGHQQLQSAIISKINPP